MRVRTSIWICESSRLAGSWKCESLDSGSNRCHRSPQRLLPDRQDYTGQDSSGCLIFLLFDKQWKLDINPDADPVLELTLCLRTPRSRAVRLLSPTTGPLLVCHLFVGPAVSDSTCELEHDLGRTRAHVLINKPKCKPLHTSSTNTRSVCQCPAIVLGLVNASPHIPLASLPNQKGSSEYPGLADHGLSRACRRFPACLKATVIK